ncbi:MAG: UvrD-helicase domain-containing protein [Nocardioidaceae bacterium]
MSATVFDLCGPLPAGTTVLEASAGTGKTHTIAALAARYVAEGVARIDELMLVTFGRAATVELRERVRERLVSTSAALADPEAAGHPDEVVRHLATGSADDVAVRRARLAHAVANFDAATIATTHGFCHQMLAGLGIAADVDRDVAFTESIADVVAEVATDLYVRAYARTGAGTPPFGYADAARVALAAVADRQARLEPVGAAPDSEADLRRRLAEQVRLEVEHRTRSRRGMDYDDLLVHLRDALVDPDTGADARARVRNRYRVVLVDEFQDTDPVQWQILEHAFHGHRTLVLIGDPKQAIYAFRGADVVTYLLATGSAQASETLGTNWRSDAPLVQALGHVMGDVALGDQRIVVRPVGAANTGQRLKGAPVDTPLRLRVVDRDTLPTSQRGLLAVKDVRPYVARDVAADIVRLLDSGATLDHADGGRPVRPADVAVLVQRNEDGATVRDELQAVDVPVVLTSTSSVFLSDAADDWLTLLSALEQPHRPGLARSAALTGFVGWTADRLAAADDAAFDDLGARLHTWAEVLTSRGVAALLEVVTGDGLVERVLATQHGERHLTDLRHIGQSLHAAATDGQLGVASLVEWLQRRIAEAREDVSEERSRRLESDAEAVQVITVHRSKGLEFPIVYVPYLWDKHVFPNPDPLRLHDPAGVRVLDVGGTGGDGYAGRRSLHLAEDAGESLRLAYVALTRARCQVVAHWAPAGNTKTAPLHRFLFGDRTTDGQLPEQVAVGSDDFVRRRLDELAAGSGGTVAVEAVVAGDGPAWRPPAPSYPTLAVRGFDRVLDLAWTRTSYSGLTAGLHEEPAARGVSSEAEEPGTVDEPELATGGTAATDGLPSPMADLPKGAAFGTLVHEVLEHTDFTAPDLRAHLVEQAEAAASERYAGIPASELAAALQPALETPLGPLAGGLRLADVGRRDRLDELDFELPLLGGDVPSGEARVGEIAAVLARHLPDGDPLHGYAADLAVPVLAARRLRGFLGGSIDLVLRVRGEDGAARHLVVDYKTNWLGGATVSTADYTPEAMASAMRTAHYPLQALLYSVALHRFLRWRQPGYDPAVHLGGVLYLFLRGMAGPATPVVDGVPCGVFSWRPPAALVTDLSDLLDRGPR